jgi:hypothetical protein
MLALLFGMVGVAGIEALRDRTPRKPFSWRRPDLEWWSRRRSARERARVAVSMGNDR